MTSQFAHLITSSLTYDCTSKTLLTGTIIYFSTYFFHERWRTRPGLPLVIASNSVWMAGPLYGLYTSYRLIQDGHFGVFRG